MMAPRTNNSTEVGNASRRELLAEMLREAASNETCSCPVSHGQNALLFLHGMAPRSPAYNVAFVARVTSVVDSNALERALQRVIDRHASLRSTYEEKDGSLCQIVHGAMRVVLERIDSAAWSQEKLDAAVSDAFAEPYDLKNGRHFGPCFLPDRRQSMSCFRDSSHCH